MKKLLILCMAVFMALGFVGVASAAPTLFADFNGDMMPDTNITLNAGDAFTLDLYADGLTTLLPPLPGYTYEEFIGFSMNVNFNQDPVTETFSPMQVNATSAAINTGLFNGSANIDPYNPGASTRPERLAHVFMVGGAIEAQRPLDQDKYLLGSIMFQCEGLGTSIIDFAPTTSGSYFSATFLSPTGQEFPQFFLPDMDSFDVTVNQVPIPGALVLLGSGLLGLLGLRRRMKK